jgi:hypothetical protein
MKGLQELAKDSQELKNSTSDLLEKTHQLTDEIFTLQFEFSYMEGVVIPMVEDLLNKCYCINKCATCPRNITGNMQYPPFKKCGHNMAVIYREEHKND